MNLIQKIIKKIQINELNHGNYWYMNIVQLKLFGYLKIK